MLLECFWDWSTFGVKQINMVNVPSVDIISFQASYYIILVVDYVMLTDCSIATVVFSFDL